VQDAQTYSFPRWPAKSVWDAAGQGRDDHYSEQWFALRSDGTHASWIERGKEEEDRFAILSLTLVNLWLAPW